MYSFRKIPVVIQAIRLTEEKVIITREGTMTGNVGDWLITGVEGEQYPCSDSVFRATYQPENAEAAAYFDPSVLYVDPAGHASGSLPVEPAAPVIPADEIPGRFRLTWDGYLADAPTIKAAREVAAANGVARGVITNLDTGAAFPLI